MKTIRKLYNSAKVCQKTNRKTGISEEPDQEEFGIHSQSSGKEKRLSGGSFIDAHAVDLLFSQDVFAKPAGKKRRYSRSKIADFSTDTRKVSKSSSLRTNFCGIQMLSESLHKQIFGNIAEKEPPVEVQARVRQHLTEHDLWGKPTSLLEDIDVQLPPLEGKDIAEHFLNIADKQLSKYREILNDFIADDVPEIPSQWSFTPGWTRYSESGHFESVPFPDDDALVLDIEVCVREGQNPTLATAVSNKYWYSWCSNQLIKQQPNSDPDFKYTPFMFIPCETSENQIKQTLKSQRERLIIGHNVSYDRARVKEQYFMEGTQLRFLDTMSMHIAVSGITSYQRNVLQATKADNEAALIRLNKQRPVNPILEWQNVSSFNGLADVYKLYCGGPGLDKQKRDIFVEGTLQDVRENFQELMTYCARDTQATFRVIQALYPEFEERFPHPVTFAGMLEMNNAFLPVNDNWNRYVRKSEEAYKEIENEVSHVLRREAEFACRLLVDEQFKKDPWLWDLDWSTQEIKFKKPKTSKAKRTSVVTPADESVSPEELELREKFRSLLETQQNLYKRSETLSLNLSTSIRVVPKILKLTWSNYPLQYHKDLGWGYLVPGRPLDKCRVVEGSVESTFPLQRALELFPPSQHTVTEERITSGTITVEEAMKNLQIMTSDTADPAALNRMWNAVRETREDEAELEETDQKKHLAVTKDHPSWHQGIGPYDIGVPGCWFFRLPHKLGAANNVGNPLAKDYLSKIEDGTLQSKSNIVAEHLLRGSRTISYWRNARDRISSQLVVWLERSYLPRYVTTAADYDPSEPLGTILPLIVVSGTLTRRAVEATWLTASNAYKDRIGSELKAMIQSPPGCVFVGADVDSQELWIASVIGDAHFAGIHGATALGWMTLQGKKSEGTDMHSRTAMAASISRDQAKVINYGRIYGAGERFAKTLLMQFNHALTEAEAVEKAQRMYAITKGKLMLRLSAKGKQMAAVAGENGDELFTYERINEMRKKVKCINEPVVQRLAKTPTDKLVEKKFWTGGSESHMFNKLEDIAQSETPRTPVLGCRISRALEPRNVGTEFMTSRVNWVVQSSAVDYLHLLLVSMRYLFAKYKIQGRFCISIHDEVRYLVSKEDRFRAALALQIANLWTRAMFAYQLGMNDLPQSVAFFSSVDIDTVIRKEVDMDCVTPSNPYGLRQGYSVPFGESYDVYKILKHTTGKL
nr:EOG090X00SQ [Eulimnadia texana]